MLLVKERLRSVVSDWLGEWHHPCPEAVPSQRRNSALEFVSLGRLGAKMKIPASCCHIHANQQL